MLLQSLYFSRFLPNRPRPLSSFDTHAIAARNVVSHADVLAVSSESVTNPLERLRGRLPVTQSARSRRSYGKTEGCEQASPRVDSKFFSSVKCKVMFSAPTTGTRNVKRDGLWETLPSGLPIARQRREISLSHVLSFKENVYTRRQFFCLFELAYVFKNSVSGKFTYIRHLNHNLKVWKTQIIRGQKISYPGPLNAPQLRLSCSSLTTKTILSSFIILCVFFFFWLTSKT